MFAKDSIIDGKYRVVGPCSESGGMGTLIYVSPLEGSFEFPIVMKYCRNTNEECVRRFQREVRLLRAFAGNSRVVQIVDANLKHEPPYFVMKYYPDGDLTTLTKRLMSDLELQEKVFGQMIDCVKELHSSGKYHRDIKPQNFLRDGSRIVVSDFGLSTELESKSAFTSSSMSWGTQGYLPPEFHQRGGFKNADALGDIFMLGKSFYVLLTGRDPLYLVPDGIPEPLFVIIERCCALDKTARYKDLAALKQSLTSAYDVLLGRVHGPGKAGQLLSNLMDRLAKDGQYRTTEIAEFIEQLAILNDEDRVRFCFEIKNAFFEVIKQELVQSHLGTFLKVYREMVEGAEYAWSYAEDIANNMKLLFFSQYVSPANKMTALELAIIAACRQNRFAAMDTCIGMITSITDDNLAIRVREMMLRYHETFISNIEQSKCRHEAIRAVLNQIQTKAGTD